MIRNISKDNLHKYIAKSDFINANYDYFSLTIKSIHNFFALFIDSSLVLDKVSIIKSLIWELKTSLYLRQFIKDY